MNIKNAFQTPKNQFERVEESGLDVVKVQSKIFNNIFYRWNGERCFINPKDCLGSFETIFNCQLKAMRLEQKMQNLFFNL